LLRKVEAVVGINIDVAVDSNVQVTCPLSVCTTPAISLWRLQCADVITRMCVTCYPLNCIVGKFAYNLDSPTKSLYIT